MTRILLFLTLILITISSFAQKTKVRGRIIDTKTKENIPFVNLIFVGTSTGTVSDFEGIFFLETDEKVDSLFISCLGYKNKTISINANGFNDLIIELEPQDNILDEITVYAGENPADILLRKVIQNKKRNNPEKLGNLKYELYNKMEFDINNFTEEYKDDRIFKNYQFIFQYADTSVETGKTYLPIFITEAISDFYYQENPRKQKEIIKATRSSGVENESIAQFTGHMYLDVNMYQNFIDIASKPFVSPLALQAQMVYEYYLVDSAFIKKKWCYQLTFKPKRKHEYTFTGNMWVHDSTFAIQRIEARISEDANLNYLNDVLINQEFELINDSIWFLKEDKLFMDFNLTDKTTGLFGRKTTSRRNIETNAKFDDNFFATGITNDIVLNKNADEKDDEYWQNARHNKLTKKELEIYNMVDSIKNMPNFKGIVNFITFLTTGYYIANNFEFGPYANLYSYNEIEGNRLYLGMRTSNDFSKKIEYSGFLAYGFKDEKIKYGAGIKYKLNHDKWRFLNISYKNDMLQLSKSNELVSEDNILTTIFSQNPDVNLLLVSDFRIFFKSDWFKGFSYKLELANKIIYPSYIHPFKLQNSAENLQNINNNTLNFTARYARNEKTINSQFSRYSMGSKFPIFSLNASYSPKNVLGNDYPFQSLQLQVHHKFFLGTLGELIYTAQAGKIWGTVPYPLLRLHEGSETYIFDPYAFNLMNYYEFASDQYISLFAEHHFQGIFFNKIPILRRLNFREVLYAKGVMGSLRNENMNLIEFPESLSELKTPYYEAGVGIENIFKVFRLDAIWRLSHLDKANAQKFGLRLGIQVIL